MILLLFIYTNIINSKKANYQVKNYSVEGFYFLTKVNNENMYNSSWYNNLIKPFLAPPDWIFQPMWIILYFTLFLAFLIYFLSNNSSKKKGYIFFVTQLCLNFLWSPVFFGIKNISLALIVIILMVIFTISSIREFYLISKPAGLILIPYLIWIIFAAYLNFGYLYLNNANLIYK